MTQTKTKKRVVIDRWSGNSLSNVPAIVSRLRWGSWVVGFDIETTSTDPTRDKIITLAFRPGVRGETVVFDVRHLQPQELRLLGSMLEPLFNGTVELVGQNLKFDMEFVWLQMGLAGHRAYDTMLAEQVILGLGTSSAHERGIGLSMADIASRYGFHAHKEERDWFIHLDEREDWWLPLPEDQLSYIEQDVTVPQQIKAAQGLKIEELELEGPIQLEMRDLFPVVGMEGWGVQIDVDGWLSVIDRVSEKAKQLESIVHLGKEGEHEGLDVHVLKVRHQKYMDKLLPYEEWYKAREAFIATRKQEWEEHKTAGPGESHVLTTPEETFNLNTYKNWLEYKKAVLEWYDASHEKFPKPPASKSGVNLGSSKQVLDGFTDLLGEVPKDNKGKPSVGEENLAPYINRHPLVQAYIDYKHAQKIVDVYGRERGRKDYSFVELLDETGRLRAGYHQIGADTERKSSYRPNLQQAPDRGVGKELRRYVVPAPGYVFVDADFSNIELRILAELSAEVEGRSHFLLDAFASGVDVHSYVAGILFRLPPEKINKKWTSENEVFPGIPYRYVAKTGSYMLIYGGGKRRLAAELKAPPKEADELFGLFHEAFATELEWLSRQRRRLDQASRRGEKRVYAETRAGWKRWFDIPPHPQRFVPGQDRRMRVVPEEEYAVALDEWKQSMASIRRQLANTPIQGLSAAITKLAEVLWYERVGYDDGMRLVASIHDELLVEARLGREQEAVETLREVMVEAMSTYLKVVDLGKVEPAVVPYWSH